MARKLQAKADLPASQHAAASDLAAARRVLAVEGAGLAALSDSLDEGFATAVEYILGATGRVVVTGMGKSGHVGRKIAATLSSTGTPALYVHPGEASHGDLGMIADGDVIIAMSNSGNTAELSDLVTYARRFAIPLIAMTAKASSTLAKQANCVLLLPPAEEACPMGLAPTTSTTMMLALGDALAIAVLERKGFSSGDFHLLHPGGALGRRLLRVGDIMHGPEELPLTGPDAMMQDAILVMTTRRFGCVGITDEQGRLVGVITDGDLRRHMNGNLLAQTAGEIMTHAPKTVRADALAAEALGLMNRRAITSLFVVAEEERPVGIVHIHDCLRAGIA